ncbi:hypothetical protein CR513_13313, partial [Mucuna pruriens]
MIRKKSANEAYAFIEDMASNTNHYFLGDGHVTRRPAEGYDFIMCLPRSLEGEGTTWMDEDGGVWND